MGRNWRDFRGSVTVKLAVIAGILIVLLIPQKMVEGLIRERSSERTSAAQAVSRSWGNPQTIGGPIVVVPFRFGVLDRQGVTRWVRDELYLLPLELTIEGGAEMQVLSRGIYQIPVYSASLSVTGRLRPIAIDGSSYEGLEILWNEAKLALPLSDPRSLSDPVVLRLGTETIEFGPGAASIDGVGPMLTAPISALDPARFAEPLDFSFELTLAGTGSLDFRPDGDSTRIDLVSGWPSPSFRGAYLPDRRSVSGDGFTASWQVLSLGRGYPSAWRASDHQLTTPPPFTAALQATSDAGFGVEFLVPVNVHTSSLRAIKYAGLYLAVTFAAFFLFEIFTTTRLHPLQYLSVGLANGIFYLLLLALAEHAGFGAAYVASATASTALIGGYAAAILGSNRRASPMVGLLAALYGYLYTTLRAEDFALLVGAIGLFVLLSAFMYVTRNIDWYGLELATVSGSNANVGDGGDSA